MKSMLFVFSLILLTSAVAYSEPTISITASVEGDCRLFNEKSNNYKYEGKCDVSQQESANKNEYDITLGNGDSYRFIQDGAKYKVKTPNGWSDHKATMTDSGNVATFEWYKWKLTADISEAMESSTKSTATADADGTVPALSDLVGAKAGQAESTVETRGYTWIKTDKSGGSSYTYWRESGSNKCVTIRTADGRYQSIVYAMDIDCQSDTVEETKASSAERAGQGKFDATGKIPCAQAKGQPMGQCSFGVARDGGGTATVSITLPDGRKRVIFFENGKAVSADLSQADGNMDFSYTKESDLYMINAGNERYEIPDAVIYGG
jgi:hypothetical protein